MAYNMNDLNYAWDKAQLLNSQGYTNPNYDVAEGKWSAQDALNVFEAEGFTPESHYNQYGKGEGLSWGSTGTTEPDTSSTYSPWSRSGGGGGSSSTSPGTTVSIPDYALRNQEEMSAKIPEYFETLMGSGIENYSDAYKNLAALPGQIDDWTAESLKRQRVTGDQATGVFNQVANQRAGGGIQGGTEAQNLEANAQANLSQIILENQNNIQNQANQLKSGTIQNMPSAALMPISNALSLYGTSANEAVNWGNMAMNTLLSSY